MRNCISQHDKQLACLDVLPEIVNGAICRLQSELDKANDACQFLTVDESSFILASQQSVWKYGTPATQSLFCGRSRLT
ncbi:hypothetical protein T07_9395 [Trichinella nelsoni]|uniref:Uncharacterized protein n=1 Tax=Trichinella nelsoni TaxID=6336 RepID=A0A0V0S5Y3_9BILA|nr:hypothetical protein T07_9395 [Trichinella nelsoni]